MIKQVLIGAVVLLSGVAHASPSMQALFNTIRATGTSIVMDDPRICKDPTSFGNYLFIKDQVDQLTLCVENHKGDTAELYDTILHEAVHVAQACNGGRNLFTAVSIVKAADPEDVVFLNEKYPQHQFARELEARVIARDQDEVYITELIKEHCK